MSARVPTPEQAAAIGAGGRDVLLEAGAGTGKTGVMVDRYYRLACEEGVSPDAILAFTFTDRAAAELRQRIRAELARRAGEGSAPAAELLSAIGGAWVTTIHGFCGRLLSAHPVAAGIDPDFRVLDAPEAARAAREAFDEALAEFLADGDERREETVAAFDLDGLRAIVIAAHAELRSRGVAEPRLPEPPPPDPAAANRRAAEAAAAAIEDLPEGNGKRELVRRGLARLRAPDPPGLDELRALHPGSRAKALAPYCEALDAAISRTAEAGEGGEAYGHLALLLELFSARFEAAKRRRAGIDFEDLQILAARLLERAEIGGAYRERFSHLLVDEFQDTNRLQLRLIEALRGPRTELVAVGDELQSIYGFRHADLEVFREQRRLVEERPDAELMALSGNFRSRPEVIAAVNRFGEALLGERYRPLRVGTEPQGTQPAPPTGGGPPVELQLTARDGWDGEGIELEPAIDGRTPLNCLAEARFLAARLRELADAGVPRGEMVVLLRAYTHLDAYEDSLERAGLRPYVVGGRGYWSQQQVGDVCALLATIVNPLDDQVLFGALASPACGAAPDTLWLLAAAAGRDRHVWPALERAAGAGEAELAEPERLDQIPEPELALLRRFAARLDSLRGRAPRLPLAGLIEAAVTETGYDLAVLTRPAGEARWANVRKLTRLAAEFEAREGRDPRGLLDFLASRAESEAEAQAATAAEGHDGVRIMTVHNAKGLEFDVVAVPDLSRGLLAGTRAPLLTLGREQPPRVGMQLRRLGAGSVNLFDHAALCEEARGRDSEEGLRLFHVAATRARERLILSGIVKPEPGRETKPGTSVVERLIDALGIGRDADSRVAVPPPQPRPGLEAELRRERDRGPGQPALGRAGPRAGQGPARGRRRASAGAGPAAAGRTPAAERAEPPALLHRDLRLRGVPLPLPDGARARPRRARPRFCPDSGWNRERAGRGGGDGARRAGGAGGAGRRGARAAGVEPGQRVDRAAGRAGATSRARRRPARRRDRPRAAARARARVARLAAAAGGDRRRRRSDAGRGADPPRRRRHRPARLDRPAGATRGLAPPGRRLQDRPPGRRRARRALRNPAHRLRPRRRRVPGRGGGRGRLRLPRAARGAGSLAPGRRRDAGRARAAGGDDRPHR